MGSYKLVNKVKSAMVLVMRKIKSLSVGTVENKKPSLRKCVKVI